MDINVTKTYSGKWDDPENEGEYIKWRIDEDGDLWLETSWTHGSTLPMQFVIDLAEAVQVSEMLEDMTKEDTQPHQQKGDENE